MKSEITFVHNQRTARGRKSGVTKLAKRRYPIGAELIGPKETHFRVWAPKAQHVDLVLEESAEKNEKRTFHPLEAEDGGYFYGVANVGEGSFYRFRFIEYVTLYTGVACLLCL